MITLKRGCDLTDLLATCRFALLVKSLQQWFPNFFVRGTLEADGQGTSARVVT